MVLLRQEEFAGDLGPLFGGQLNGQVVHGHSAVLGYCAGQRRHAHLQAAGGFGHPLARQAAIQQVAEAGRRSGDSTETNQPCP